MENLFTSHKIYGLGLGQEEVVLYTPKQRTPPSSRIDRCHTDPTRRGPLLHTDQVRPMNSPYDGGRQS